MQSSNNTTELNPPTAFEGVDVTPLLDKYGVTRDEALSCDRQQSCQLLHTDGDNLLMRPEDRGYVMGMLGAIADDRRELRVEVADQTLTAAWDTLTAAVRSKQNPAKLPGLHRAVTDAFMELVDAKQAAGRMSPARADGLRAQAGALQAKADAFTAAAMRRSLRFLRGC